MRDRILAACMMYVLELLLLLKIWRDDAGNLSLLEDHEFKPIQIALVIADILLLTTPLTIFFQ